jgi:hypothetical protein
MPGHIENIAFADYADAAHDKMEAARRLASSCKGSVAWL